MLVANNDLQPKLEKCIKSIEENGTQVTAAMTVDCDLFVHALIQDYDVDEVSAQK
ncbi:unnamed protein product [Aureobasidium pullulans]|nr:unnamed protein product [Aureobasidium pullulans]